ncbi:MAG: serine/threonine-protein kinase [Planctomycetaceae bacterium]|nr:serine/threonine-protein kinase [Planctomycetaceae bacterium]
MNRSPATCESSIDALSSELQERLAEVLESYLDALERGQTPNADEFIARYPDLAEPLRAHLGGLDFLHAAMAEFRSSDPSRSPTPDFSWKQLGDYAIVRQIGRGGMGVVYEARQISLDRRVALKVLPFAAVLDQKQIARFYNEAQAAAHLQHPNIVPVFFVGCERGVHYYAMQYVEGQPLDLAIRQLRRVADEGRKLVPPGDPTAAAAGDDTAPRNSSAWRQFTTSGSLTCDAFFRTVARLGVDAAEALDYAHECGIIHRDVKPSNLLLDDHGKIWITDFGLARFQANDRLTATGDLMGTARYMSPEQVAGRPGAVDHRTDVYSLGITLYELATLTEAFDGANRQEIYRRIADEEPRRPRQANPAIPIDLETILLKAIAKLPSERYSTAHELADDLRRFLANEPVSARRASLRDRAAKWARRHRTLVTATAIMMLIGLVGAVLSSLLIAREHYETKAALAQAESNLHRAETHFRQLREVVDRFGAHHAERLKGLPGAEPLRHELLLDTLGYYRGFIQYANNDPTFQADLAITYSKAAAVKEQLGDKVAALADYRQAAQALEPVAVAHPEDPQFWADLAICHNNIGLLLSAAGKPDDAEKAYQRALAIQSRLIAENPGDVRYQSDLALTYGNMGLLASGVNQLSKAGQAYEHATSIQEKLAERFPQKPEHQHDLAVSYNNLSFLQAKTDPLTAERSSKKALAIQERLVRLQPNNADYQSDLALSYNNLGALQSCNRQVGDAEASYRRAIAVQEQLVRKSPSVIRFRCELAVSHNNLGRLHSKANSLNNANKSFESARAIMKELVDDYPNEPGYRSTLGGILNNLGRTLEQLGRLDDATKIYEQAVLEQRFACEHAPQETQFREFLTKQYANYRRALLASGQREKEATAAADEAKLLPRHPKSE